MRLGAPRDELRRHAATNQEMEMRNPMDQAILGGPFDEPSAHGARFAGNRVHLHESPIAFFRSVRDVVTELAFWDIRA